MSDSDTGRGRELARMLGPIGAWTFALDELSSDDGREVARTAERLGYGALWFPETQGSREALSQAAVLLAATGRLPVATGIANVWGRDPTAMMNGARGLWDAHPGRFVLGIGISHAPSVQARGHAYERPLDHMRAYLDTMDRARYDAPGERRPPRVLAALGDGMLRLAAERADGAHSYFVPASHTPRAREVLGPEPFLAVEQTVVLETDPAAAREVARGFAVHYLELPNYANNLRRLGFDEDDVAGTGSDRMIDAVIAWGDEEAIAARVREHLDAGADHVCLQVRGADSADPRLDDLRRLAEVLLPSG